MRTKAIEFVYGYHGCAKAVAYSVLHDDGVELQSSENDYDWLGSGIYFWEEGPRRAWEWAKQRFGENDAAVLCAKIKLGNCLNLMDIDSYRLLRQTYDKLLESGIALPTNGNKLHRLDCMVVNAALKYAEDVGTRPYDTVRCPFVEGEPVFPDSRFFDLTHIQISVRTPESILELYEVLPE